MGELVHFIGRADLDAQQNLKAFIAHTRETMPFTNINWEDDSWNITSFTPGRNQGKVKKIAHFRSMRDPSGNKSTVEIPLLDPFKTFAKSAFSEMMRRFRLSEHRRMLYALQAMEQALIDLNQKPCVTAITADTLDQAAILVDKRFADGWHTGRMLERLLTQIIIPCKLISHAIEWKSPIPYKQPARNDRINTERKTEKMPQLQSILDLAYIHHTSEHLPDRIVTSFVSLSMFAPSRASEILSLPVHCVTEAEGDDGPIMGIRWKPAKGGSPITKFATSDASEEMALEVIGFLKEVGASARKAAEWYAQNPTKLYLPEELEHLRDQPITMWEAALILGRKKPFLTKTDAGLALKSLPDITTDRARIDEGVKWARLYSFEALQAHVLGKLPDMFPIQDSHTGLMWHEALFLLPENALRPNSELHRHVPTTLSINQINNQLGANPAGLTIFSRNQKFDSSGLPVRITTHQFRHLLNTLAQSKHLSEALIAFWSGRKKLGQNEWYDHLPQEAFIEAYTTLGEASVQLPVHGPLVEKATAVAAANSISYDAAMKLELGAIHITRFGLCRHDYSLTPCPKDKDCPNCGEHAFVKGDERHHKEAFYQYYILEKALENAYTAQSNGDSGASRWIKQNAPKLERWRKALELMADSSIPNGTLISLPPPDHSQSKTGLSEAVKLVNFGPVTEVGIEDESDEQTLLDLEFF
ncbi:hypothetical protein [Pseudomonas rhodesiae]|uniref:hypothetical protein n=1 Tax=Pseudomonas rhodesiae TaxID=76760 RepID=UPI00289FD6F2|nr:hypothetical protein [Pseudomonas rhodesiae]